MKQILFTKQEIKSIYSKKAAEINGLLLMIASFITLSRDNNSECKTEKKTTKKVRRIETYRMISAYKILKLTLIHYRPYLIFSICVYVQKNLMKSLLD